MKQSEQKDHEPAEKAGMNYAVNDKRLEGKYIYRAVCGLIITAFCTLTFFLVWYLFVREHNQTGHLLGYANLLMALFAYAVFCTAFLHGLGGFKIGVERKMNTIASELTALCLTDLLEVFISMAITGQVRFFGAFFWRYLLLWLMQCVVVTFMANFMINRYRKLFPPLKIIEFYGEHLNKLYIKVNSRPDKYDVCTLMNCNESLSTIRKALLEHDAVLINDLPSKRKNQILKLCFAENKRVYFTPKISDILVKSAEELTLFDTPLYLCRNKGMSYSYRALKRFFDVVISAVGLVVLSPLFLIVAIMIKTEDGGPVFFRQERVTLGGKRFMIYKFRSMIVGAEQDGKSHPAGEHDDRITKIGRKIRANRIDELPQLINILKGDMSIVGPRPERVEHVEKYTADIPEFRFRTKVKGGLTGYAQVYGKYNTTALDKLKLDLIYITNCSPLVDIQIILETVRVIFQKESTEGFSEEQQEKIMEDNVAGK